MKKILITGANSYIGRSLITYLQTQSNYILEELDVRTDQWKNVDFSQFDTVFHVAAIVHQNEKKIDPSLYDRVNRDLPIEIATVAKSAGVGQFIFLSSMSVYDGSEKMITKKTKEQPTTYYGKSKLAAEIGLAKLIDENFKIAIIRPPMVYGLNATGNYTRLSKLAKFTFVFPNIVNHRSMIFVDNLCEFIKQTIDRGLSGLYFPQNKEFVSTPELVKTIRKVNGNHTLLTPIFNPIIKKLGNIKQIDKLFGNLVYERELSLYDFDYQLVDFETSVKQSECGEKNEP